MIRLIIAMIFYGLFVIATPFLFAYLAIVGKFSQNRKDRMSFAIVTWVLRNITNIAGVKKNIIGRENIPDDTAVLYVSNHRSYFDIIISYTYVKPLCGYVAKKELGKAHVLGAWMRRVHCLFLDRENLKEGMKTILQGVEMLKGGTSIFVFPEGSRAETDDEMGEFKEGSFKMAVKAKVPIVPVAINNTSAIFEDHFPSLRPEPMVMEFGKPIYIDELSPEDKKHIGEYTNKVIRGMVEKNKNLL